MKPKSESLSKRERQIMDVLYQRGSAAAAEVQAELPDPPGYSATRALLAVLVNKGQVTHESDGNRYIYRPCEPKKKAGRSALARVLNTFYEGSLSAAVAGLLETRSEQISPEEIARLRKLLNEAEKNRGPTKK